ncbi:GFA family protein [Mesorhizobium australafricanum]|uniref:GFA family protein n=1 Tax=Mesorhizobium australafricanum TaxID=3072311 RepID=A0ABU4X5Q0_9HYPH|nr:GFA family protein [Mesorhizobium sp. VK3E]MDX8442462.1 GFA family protein [Mesorhizobium sp. VK3E]
MLPQAATRCGREFCRRPFDVAFACQAPSFAKRGFCKTCGAVLFWKPHQDAYVSVLAGSFDEPTGLQGQSHIFVGDKGDYYSI